MVLSLTFIGCIARSLLTNLTSFYYPCLDNHPGKHVLIVKLSLGLFLWNCHISYILNYNLLLQQYNYIIRYMIQTVCHGKSGWFPKAETGLLTEKVRQWQAERPMTLNIFLKGKSSNNCIFGWIKTFAVLKFAFVGFTWLLAKFKLLLKCLLINRF